MSPLIYEQVAFMCHELEHWHRELSHTLNWKMDWTTDANAPTYGLIIRRMAAAELAIELAEGK